MTFANYFQVIVVWSGSQDSAVAAAAFVVFENAKAGPERVEARQGGPT